MIAIAEFFLWFAAWMGVFVASLAALAAIAGALAAFTYGIGYMVAAPVAAVLWIARKVRP